MTMAYVALAVAVVGAGTSAYGQYAAGENATEVADYKDGVEKNAAIDAQNRGTVAAAEHRDKVKRMIGTQRASMAASGVASDTGTGLDLLAETAGMGELDALRILNNSQREAEGLNSQAQLTTMQGKFSKNAGTLSAGASLLSGASNAYYGFKAGQAREKG